MEFDVVSAEHRVSRLGDAELSLKKLITAISQAALADDRKKLAYLKAAMSYVGGMDPHLVKVRLLKNELDSLHDGVVAGLLKPEEFVFSAAREQLTQVGKTKSDLQKKIQANSPSSELQTLNKYARFRKNLPNVKKHGFGIARMPVVFTNVSKGGHAYTGSISLEVLQETGFRAEEFEYYTVMLDQVIICVDPQRNTKIVEAVGGDRKRVLKTVTDTKRSVKSGKEFEFERPRTLLDEALEIKRLLEDRTKTKWSLVSESAASPTAGVVGAFFWAMRDSDLRRFARAFQGNHVKIHKWGFA